MHNQPATAAREPSTGNGAIIRLRNVEKCYRTKAGFTYVLRQINLTIAEGEFVTVMGPSGAGKSTLLGILGLHDHTWEGEFALSDHPVHRLSAKDRSFPREPGVFATPDAWIPCMMQSELDPSQLALRPH